MLVYTKIFGLLDARERRRFFQLLALVVGMGLLEAVGIASILPFLVVLSNPEVVTGDGVLGQFYRFTGVGTTHSFLIILGSGVFAFLLGSLAFKSFVFYAVNRFSAMRNYTLGMRLLGRYLSQPYTWFLQRHSADLGKTLLMEVSQVVSGAVVPAMRALAQGAVVLFLIGLLLITDPAVAMLAAVIVGGSYIALMLFFRRYLDRIGRDQLAANQERFRLASEALGGIKEVKLKALEPVFLARFRDPSERHARHQAASLVINELPRNILEAILFGGMMVLVLVMLARKDAGLADLIPTLGLFAFAGARLFPAMQSVYRDVNMMRFAGGALDSVLNDYRSAQDPVFPSAPPEPMRLKRTLALDGVDFSYPGAGRAALTGLSMLINANTTVGIVGGTGAGKTTVVDVILGFLTPDAGVLSVDGVAIGPDNLRAWQRTVGYVPQDIFLVDSSIRENIAFGVAPERIDQAAVERAARIAELHDFILTQLPQGYDTMVGERGVRLSGGQRQRIGIARALYHDPDVLVFDEATSALDNLTERAVMETINGLAHRKTIIMIAHRLSTVRDCDRIFLLSDGAVRASGTFDELVARDATFEAMARTA